MTRKQQGRPHGRPFTRQEHQAPQGQVRRGTHTHIPTSDHRILRGGTALMADAGMCGDYDSVIGVEVEEPLNRFLTGIANGRFTPAEGEATLSGIAIETGPRTGLVVHLSPVRVGGSLAQAEPAF